LSSERVVVSALFFDRVSILNDATKENFDEVSMRMKENPGFDSQD